MRPEDLAGLAQQVHSRLAASAPDGTVDRAVVAAAVRRDHPLLAEPDVEAVTDAVTARASGLGLLERILADPAVTEVMVNGAGPVWVERQGKLEATPLTLGATDVDLLIERIVGPLGLRADPRSPVADARLPDGSRVNVVVPPLAVDGPCVTIRRFGARPIPLAAMCPPGVEELLSWAVRARCNIVVSGGTGAGKTTLLNALAALLPPEERIVTVEDTAELRLPHGHVVRLEARPASADGVGAVTVRQLVRNALRMRPDRIVVGEVRGAEALDMLWAMNTGHEGSLSTCHANSPLDALRRLEVMVLTAGLDLPLVAIRDQLTAALDLVVQVARLADGSRRVVAVGEVVDRPSSDERLRPLAGPTGLHRLPERPARAAGAAAPSPAWCV
ncbi:MAG TPA: ATPase, T2SS/T4P/T4SS family [Acidimicrobiales bacterium]|nr:ATPase, T2SS/T4P/T4SS family [Acidimicrobiales bacterium]